MRAISLGGLPPLEPAPPLAPQPPQPPLHSIRGTLFGYVDVVRYHQLCDLMGSMRAYLNDHDITDECHSFDDVEGWADVFYCGGPDNRRLGRTRHVGKVRLK